MPEEIEYIKTKRVPVELEFKNKNGDIIKMKGVRIVANSPSKPKAK